MSNRICDILGIEKPVIQGPMVYLTDAKLVAAVSNAGGMGSLGPHAGQVDSTKDPVERAERLRAQIRQVKELTDKPFSVNVLPSQHHEDNDLFTPPSSRSSSRRRYQPSRLSASRTSRWCACSDSSRSAG